MGITFAKAPLVELIAELRWFPPESGAKGEPTRPQQPAPQTIILGGNKQEEFYMRAGGALYKLGFDRSERLTPTGFPLVLHQPVYRFRGESEDKQSVAFHVGNGVFSIHGIPPYHSWARFLPFIRDGINALLLSRAEDDAKGPITHLLLRYIDFFGEEFTRGRDIPTFLSEVFGISTTLPNALTKATSSKEVKSLFTKFVLPIKVGDLTVRVGDGKFNNRDGILLDMTASSSGEIAPQIEAIMDVYGAAYEVIHNVFFEMTKPLHNLMQPQGDGN